jgi:serine/threonine protein kinase
MYAAGVCMFFMLTGEYYNGNLDLIKEASPNCRKLLSELLADNPKERPTAVDVLAKEWLMSHIPGRGPPPASGLVTGTFKLPPNVHCGNGIQRPKWDGP